MYDRMIQVLTFKSIGPVIYAKPDLFNPLWINVTMAFVMSIVANLSQLFFKAEGFHFQFAFVQKAFSLVFGLGILVPALIALSFFFYGLKPSVTSTIGIIAIYSYSNLFFIFGSFFYLIPIRLVGFICLLAFALLSALSLIQNFGSFIDQYPNQGRKFVIILVLTFQALALLSYKFAFFV